MSFFSRTTGVRIVYCRILSNFDRQPPSLLYFELICRQWFPSVKVRKYGQFQKCALCVDLETSLRRAIDMSRDIRLLKLKIWSTICTSGPRLSNVTRKLKEQKFISTGTALFC